MIKKIVPVFASKIFMFLHLTQQTALTSLRVAVSITTSYFSQAPRLTLDPCIV